MMVGGEVEMMAWRLIDGSIMSRTRVLPFTLLRMKAAGARRVFGAVSLTQG